ncbi:PD-(D/E)XK nuclease family transposase [Anaerobacillus sp. HL2]|nr:PD-(D/E)XK nuclease family transposase [Anaerobacillus sp. HL2]
MLFGSDDETSKELLLALLNDVLNVPLGQSLVKLEILNPTFPKENIADKKGYTRCESKSCWL